MARTSAFPPNRSISLPSRLHPTSLRAETELNKLRAWEKRSSSSSETLTSDTIHTGLIGLSEVYRCVEELVYCSFAQNGELLENALDHSVKLLDACGIVKDLHQKLKEQVLGIQLSLCSRGYKESWVSDEISSYLTFRKKMRKEALSCIRSLKKSQRKLDVVGVPSLKDYHNSPMVVLVTVFRELNVMTSRVLRSALVFLSTTGEMIKNRRHGCSFITKIGSTEKMKRVETEVGIVDDALFCVVKGTGDLTMAERKLENLVTSLGSIEAGLDVVFRRLIRYRVSILNVLTQ